MEPIVKEEKCLRYPHKLTRGLIFIWKFFQGICRSPKRLINFVHIKSKYIHERTMKRYAKGFFKRIVDDFKYKELLSLKMVFFVHASTVFVLYPYLTIHMRELGINVEETAIMSALTPCVAILMPPVAGVIADRIGNFKILLALFSALGGLAALLLLLVPVGRVTIPFPDQVVLAMECANDTGGSFSFTVAEGEKCLKIQSSQSEVNSLETAVSTQPLDYTNINITLESCGLLCSLDQAEMSSQVAYTDIPSIMNKTSNYSISLYDVGVNGPQKYDYNISGIDFNLPWILTSLTKDVRSFRVQKKSKNFGTSVQAFSSDQYFFPAPGLFNFTCNIQTNLEEVFNCSIKKFSKENGISFPYRKFTFTTISPIFNENDTDEIDGFSHGSSMHGVSSNRPNKMNTNCYQEKWNTSVVVNMIDKAEALKFKECKPRCMMKTSRRNVCKNRFHTKEFDIKLTFWMYLTVRLMIGVIGGTAFAMFEGAVIAILREHNADYGLQHIYASIGGMISSPLSGFMIDYYSKGKGYTDFRPAFYFYGTLKILSAVLMMTINLQFKAPAKNVIDDVVRVLKKIEILALFFTCFILGTAWGYIESFLFWVLQDLGATRSLMGITITVGGIAGIPLLVMSGPIIEHIGHANVLFIGFIFYAIRLVGYSIITAPWQCLLFEAMESITSSLAYTAAVTYAAKMSTTQTDSSIQGILGGLYFGVGKGSGSLSGGYLIKYFGSRNTFRIFSAITFTTGVGYFLFNRFYIMKHSSDSIEEEEKKDKNPSNGQIEIHDVSKRKSNGHLKQTEDQTNNQGSNGEVNQGFDNLESETSLNNTVVEQRKNQMSS